jgi:transposase InsO family protein
LKADVAASVEKSVGLARICRVVGKNRSTYTARAARAARRPQGGATAPTKVGRPSPISDVELLAAIRKVLAAAIFVGEGHRKIHARLRKEGVKVSKDRVRRVMRTHELLAPVRAPSARGPRVHDGVIVTEKPDVMWGVDHTATSTLDDGLVSVFAVVDHCTAEVLGVHAAKRATRFEAVEPLMQAVRGRFGDYRKGIAEGANLSVRHDHGSQYDSRHYQDELRFLGVASSPAFVRAPEGNGCIERFFRTLKEQFLWVRSFRTVEELRRALVEWVATYNEHWLIARHGYRSPKDFRLSFPAA